MYATKIVYNSEIILDYRDMAKYLLEKGYLFSISCVGLYKTSLSFLTGFYNLHQKLMIMLAIFCYSHFEIDSRFLKNRIELELVLWQADGRATCTRCYLAEHIRLKIEVFIWLWELISTVVEGTSISHWRVSNGVWDEFIYLQIYGFLHWNNI